MAANRDTRIERVEAFILTGPKDYVADAGLAAPVGSAREVPSGVLDAVGDLHICAYPPRAQTCLVRVTDAGGRVGWGEAHAPLGPRATAAIVVDVLAPLVIGRESLAIEAHWQRMYGSQRLRGQVAGYQMEAIAGVDIALWDLVGKTLDQPVHVLLGGPLQTHLPVYASGVPGSTVEERVAQVRSLIEAGYTAIKASIGRGSVADDLDGLEPVAEEARGKADLLIDAHGAYSADSVLAVGRRLERMGVRWFEDPLPPEDLDGYGRLAAALDMPVAAGETDCTAFQVHQRLRAGAPDILLPDVCRAGGISEGRRIADLARIFNRRWAAHVSMGSPVHLAAAAHLAAASANFLVMEYPSSANPIGDVLLQAPFRPVDGTLHVPTGPGLGITFDPARLDERLVPFDKDATP